MTKRVNAFRHFVMLILVTNSIVVIPCLAADKAISAEDLTYITEQYPPFNFKEDGKLQGVSVDLLEEMWEKMGVNLNRSAARPEKI